MKFASLAVLLVALALPVAVSAQVVQQQPVQAQGQRGPATAQYQRWTKRLAGINLSSQQQQQVQSLLDQFAAQHPAGSPRDKAGDRSSVTTWARDLRLELGQVPAHALGDERRQGAVGVAEHQDAIRPQVFEQSLGFGQDDSGRVWFTEA